MRANLFAAIMKRNDGMTTTVKRLFTLTCFVLSIWTLLPLEARLHKIGKPHFHDFQIDLINPSYEKGGLFSSKGGVVWTENFRLQASEILQKETDEGTIIEAKGQILLFLNDYLLTGEHLTYNLSKLSGTLQNGVIGLGNWCIGGKKIALFSDHSVQIERAWVSSDPSEEDSWQVAASRVVLQKSQRLKFKNLSLRFLGMPVFLVPQLITTPESLRHQPVEYNVVWKGSKKRKAAVRYRFYNSKGIQLWTRLEYLIGRGPGVGLDGQANLDDSLLRVNNFVARDNSVVDPNLKTRYRFKGHYERDLSQSASLNIYYDRYSDNSVPSDYSYTPFDSLQQGQTKLVARDQKSSFIHQITHQVKINPFQTVKKQLPSYFYTPHTIRSPWKTPWEDWMSLRSHARIEYLSYDFRDKSPLNNYHSSRLYAQGFADLPLSYRGLCVTPSAGYLVSSYNKSSQGHGASVLAPTATLNMQMTWSKTAKHTHCVQPFFQTQWVGDPLKTVDEHYVFDFRDSITKQWTTRLGVEQNWYQGTRPVAGVNIQSVWIQGGQYKAPDVKERQKGSQHLEADLHWYVTDRWTLASDVQWGPVYTSRRSWNIRSEHTWTRTFANTFEWRTRNSKAWRKNAPDDYSLESYRGEDYLLHSRMSDARNTVLTQWVYQPSPNWAFRFDTAHGWKRSNLRAYSQYCMGISTDLGASWRLQLQVSKSPQDWDWRIRIDLRDTPVVPPKPRF